jgi:hypothetical protein
MSFKVSSTILARSLERPFALRLSTKLHLTGDDLPEPSDMPVNFVELLLTHTEPLFLLDKKVQQQAANWSVFHTVFQSISKAGEIFSVNKCADVFHNARFRARPALHSMRPLHRGPQGASPPKDRGEHRHAARYC